MAFLFENLTVYQKAVDLADRLTVLADEMPRGRSALADQLRRASLSIAANLAEGSGRFHKAEKRHFYLISRGSACECVPILEICRRRNIIDDNTNADIKGELDQVCRILTTLIQKAG